MANKKHRTTHRNNGVGITDASTTLIITVFALAGVASLAKKAMAWTVDFLVGPGYRLTAYVGVERMTAILLLIFIGGAIPLVFHYRWNVSVEAAAATRSWAAAVHHLVRRMASPRHRKGR